MSWDALKLVTAPSVEAISLDEAKAHLRVEDSGDDDLISSLITAARAYVEGPNGVGLALVTQTWEVNYDRWPDGERFAIPIWPVLSVSSIKYTDFSGAQQTLDTSLYTVNVDHNPAIVERAWGKVLPLTRKQTKSVILQFVAGFGAAASNVPADIKAAMLLIIGHLYKNREATDSGTAQLEIPLGASTILSRYSVGLFS